MNNILRGCNMNKIILLHLLVNLILFVQCEDCDCDENSDLKSCQIIDENIIVNEALLGEHIFSCFKGVRVAFPRLNELKIVKNDLKLRQLHLPENVTKVHLEAAELKTSFFSSLSSQLNDLFIANTIIETQELGINEMGVNLFNLTVTNCSLKQFKNSISNSKLKQLDLSYNFLETFENASYPALVILILSHNKFIYIGHTVFEKMTALEDLKLDHNNIQFITPNAFDQNHKLGHVDLTQNKLMRFQLINQSETKFKIQMDCNPLCEYLWKWNQLPYATYEGIECSASGDIWLTLSSSLVLINIMALLTFCVIRSGKKLEDKKPARPQQIQRDEVSYSEGLYDQPEIYIYDTISVSDEPSRPEIPVYEVIQKKKKQIDI